MVPISHQASSPVGATPYLNTCKTKDSSHCLAHQDTGTTASQFPCRPLAQQPASQSPCRSKQMVANAIAAFQCALKWHPSRMASTPPSACRSRPWRPPTRAVARPTRQHRRHAVAVAAAFAARLTAREHGYAVLSQFYFRSCAATSPCTICDRIGGCILLDAARVDSCAHRPRDYWASLADASAIESRLRMTQRDSKA